MAPCERPFVTCRSGGHRVTEAQSHLPEIPEVIRLGMGNQSKGNALRLNGSSWLNILALSTSNSLDVLKSASPSKVQLEL